MMTLADMFQAQGSTNEAAAAIRMSAQFPHDDFTTVSTPSVLRLIQEEDDSPKVQFPSILHNLIKDTDDSIVSWNHQGTVFCIHSREQFMATVPHYFKLKLFRSFTRQLNIWGFQGAGRGKTAYRHPKFHRDFITLCRGMSREKTTKCCPKDAIARKQSSEATSRASDPFQDTPLVTCSSSLGASMRVIGTMTKIELHASISRGPDVVCSSNNIKSMAKSQAAHSAFEETGYECSNKFNSLSSLLSHNSLMRSTIPEFGKSSRQNARPMVFNDNQIGMNLFSNGLASSRITGDAFVPFPPPDMSCLNIPAAQLQQSSSNFFPAASAEDRMFAALFKHLETKPLMNN